MNQPALELWGGIECTVNRVNDDYHEAMVKGLKVAKKQAAPDFVEAAIHAPKEVM